MRASPRGLRFAGRVLGRALHLCIALRAGAATVATVAAPKPITGNGGYWNMVLWAFVPPRGRRNGPRRDRH